MLISVLTGIAAGALHVVGGADHLIAMMPTAINQPKMALRNGLAWGLGHSAGVLTLSTIAILIKDFAHIQRMSSLAEFSVGLALVLVGALAIKTALGLDIHTHEHRHGDGHDHKHIHLHLRGKQIHNRHSHTSTGLGVLHGLAGASHLLAIIPALALPPIGAVAYMGAYFFGSIAAMGLVLCLISIATSRVGKKGLPLMVGLTGGLSIAIGLFWLHKNTLQII